MRSALIGSGLAASVTMLAQQPFDLDPSFTTAIQAERVSSIHVFPDGGALLSGAIRFPGDTWDRLTAKVLPNGSRDLTFPYTYGGGEITPWEGRFYVGSGQAVRRIWIDGSEDTGYDMFEPFDEFTPGQAGNYHVFEDGRVLLCGTHLLDDSIHGYEGYYNLIWFTNTGRLDTTRIHRKCDGFIYRIFPLPDGKFLLSGSWTEYEGTPVPNSTRLIRVFSDGSLDTTFQSPFDFGRPHSHLLLPDGKHLLTGIMGLVNDEDTIQIARLQPEGALDETFNAHLQLLYTYDTDAAFSDITTALPLGEDRFAITGAFTHVDGEPRGGMAMIDTSGQLIIDQFTGPGCGVWNDGFQDRGYLTSIVPAADGSFYIHGSYHGYDDGTTNDEDQRMVSRLYGLDVGVATLSPGEGAGVRVYPNPASGTFRLEHGETRERVDVELRSATGGLVRAWPGSARGDELSVSGIPMGMYVVEVRQKAGPAQRMKLLVE